MKFLKVRFILLIILSVIWLLLTYPFSNEEAIVGLITVFIILLLPLPRADVFADLKLNPKSIFFLFIYLFVFLKELVKANLDVAWRVIHPRMPINPGIVKVKTKCKSPLGRIILANSITLTPGTITVEMNDDTLYIHWINVEDTHIEDTTKKIVSGFEKYLEVIFG